MEGTKFLRSSDLGPLSYSQKPFDKNKNLRLLIETVVKKIAKLKIFIIFPQNLYQPKIWQYLFITSVIVSTFVISIIMALFIIKLVPLLNRELYFVPQPMGYGRIPQPDLNFHLLRSTYYIDSCPYYDIQLNRASPNGVELVSSCWRDNSQDRINAYMRQNYSGKSLSVFAPDYTENYKSFFGKYCNVELTANFSDASNADIVLINSEGKHEAFENIDRSSSQIWIMSFMESPQHTKNVSIFNNKINYTASYRSDADIITRYGGFLKSTLTEKNNISIVKPTAALWVASNCWTSNARKQLAESIAKFYPVDIYGACGKGRISSTEFEAKLKGGYRYYLSFENSNCREYITEKVFQNAFKNDMIPIVYGASKEDYLKLLPEKSYIYYGDFTSAEELVKYLRHLDTHPEVLATYFQWKSHYSSLNFNLFEKLCSVGLFAPPKMYYNIENWWQSEKCRIVTPKTLWDHQPRQ